MDQLWKAILLGVVEGITEFLPISSTGHLLLVSQLLRFEQSVVGTFEIFIQLGAVLALLAFYASDLLGQARSLPSDPGVRRFWAGVLLAFLPAATIGFLLSDWIKLVLFASPTVIAWALILGGVVFILVERRPGRAVAVGRLEAVTFRQAFLIGVVQVLALVPGVSRSGASILGGMAVGLDRPTATRFSFYLAIPTLGAATLYDLLKSLRGLTAADAGLLLVGTVVAAVVAWVSIGWLLRYVQTNSFVPFGLYRIAVGLLILALVQAGVF